MDQIKKTAHVSIDIHFHTGWLHLLQKKVDKMQTTRMRAEQTKKCYLKIIFS